MARAFSFVHTADLHLDAPFQGVDAPDQRVRDALVESTYSALDAVVATAIERSVDFVVVAGDAYNSKDKSLRAQLRFRSAMQRLDDAGVRVYLVQGNHDPASGWSAGLELPGNVRFFDTDRVERIELSDADDRVLCGLYGRGYRQAAERSNLAAGFRRDAADETAVAVLHANVNGQPGFEPYAPCSLDDLRAANMDYWALGHIHKPLELLDSPVVRYPGSPQGLNPNEDGEHGCWVVRMESGRVTGQEFVPTAAVLWARETIDAGPLSSLDEVHAAVREACDARRAQFGGRPVVIRVDLVGRSEAHAALVRGSVLTDLVAELRDEQLGIAPWVWIDRVRDLTRPLLDIEFYREVEDFSGDLVRASQDLCDRPAAAAELVDEALAGIAGAFGSREYDPCELIERARDICLDRLIGGEDR